SEADTFSEEDDYSSEEEESLDNSQKEDYNFPLRENDPVWLKQIKNPITQRLDLNHTPEELYQRNIDFKKSLKSKEDVPWDELFKLSIAKQFKLHHTPEKLHRMSIDHEKLIKTELTLALRQRELNLEEKSQLLGAIYDLDRSTEQGLLDAIFDASCIPQTSFQRVKSIVEERNVDVNSKYKEFSFLVMAAGVYKNQRLEIIQFLLDHGADIEIADGRGWTALHNAVWEKNTKVVKLLIERKANVDAQVKSPGGENWAEGWTSLHFTLYFEDFEIAKVLLDHGADPNIRDDDGKTPLDIVMKIRNEIEDETERQKFDEALNELRLSTL
ncbi:MAG: ankyrin repeat domain-containing protein, partial [Puniceicoccales bacterium]|nr:ankyrin repeat domain-containing protein [Puniceicoccales bacterium]